MRLSGLLLAILTTYACAGGPSSSPSPGGSTAGNTCSASSACAGGVCAVSADFPSGYCTQGCQLNNPASCPSGSVCIDDASGVPADSGITAVCYQACQTSADCPQAGFACLEKASHLVCRKGN